MPTKLVEVTSLDRGSLLLVCAPNSLHGAVASYLSKGWQLSVCGSCSFPGSWRVREYDIGNWAISSKPGDAVGALLSTYSVQRFLSSGKATER